MLVEDNGFTFFGANVEGSVVNYENLDNCQTVIHDYFKFFKFGFGTSSHIANLQVCLGWMTRKNAPGIVKEN